MKIPSIDGKLALPGNISKNQMPEEAFGDVLKGALNQVNELQHTADDMNMKMVMGEDIELHDVMVATSKADLALQFTAQIRNKLIEAYQEVMRMQM